MERLSANPVKSDYKLVGIPIPLGCGCLDFLSYPVAPVITEEDYLNKSKFSIPECFQIPTLPETVATESVPPNTVPTETAESSAITFVPPDPAHPNTAQSDSLKSEIEKIERVTAERKPKKRVSAGMKLTRNQIDVFAEESSSILSRINVLNVDTVQLSEQSIVNVRPILSSSSSALLNIS